MLPKTGSVKRVKTAEQALTSLMRLCARAERSSGDAMRLMAGWSVPEQEREGVLQRLIAERFIDDRRYATAFVREKVNLSGWGEYKIRATLRRKGIADEIIKGALAEIPADKAAAQLLQKLERKAKNIKYDNLYQLRTKLMRYALSLGYAMESATEGVEQVMNNRNDNEQCDDILF